MTLDGESATRNVEECEAFAERTGFACRVAGYFPHIPLPPMPVFRPSDVVVPLRKYQREPMIDSPALLR